MTLEINMMDRDEAVETHAEDREKQESEIDKLIRQISKAREELVLSGQILAELQETLAGKASKE